MILEIIKAELEVLQDKDAQLWVWTSESDAPQDYADTIHSLFDSSLLNWALAQGEAGAILEEGTTRSLVEIRDLAGQIDEALDPFDIVNLPEMEQIRQLAQAALRAPVFQSARLISAEALRANVDLAIETGKWANVQVWMRQHNQFSCNHGTSGHKSFPPEVFALILEVLQRDDFLLTKGGWKFLLMLQYDWSVLTKEQKSDLLPALVAAFPRFTDGPEMFCVAELLGQYYANMEAFLALQRLMPRVRSEGRAALIMGFNHLIKKNRGQLLARKATQELTKALQDESADVRAEVERFLVRHQKPMKKGRYKS